MESIWCKTCGREKAPALKGNIETDVAVIGGGMAGILTAWQLEQAGGTDGCVGNRSHRRWTNPEYNRKNYGAAWNVLPLIY